MTKDAPEGKTYTTGYFNNNRWPIQLVVSRYNVTLYLPPGEFIRDKQSRKINDPFFEIYVKNGQLARETSDQPVPILTVPVVSAAPATVNDGQSVRAVTEFVTDAKGVKRPVIPQPKPASEQPINKPAFVGMSMDEAKKLGLIKKVREVPEDYGVPDNSSATPPRTPPPLKVAVDTDQAAKPSDQLPKPIVQAAAALPKKDAPVRKQIQEQLKKGVQEAEALDTETGFLNVAMQNVPPGVGLSQPEPPAAAPEPEGETEVLPQPDVPVDEALPEPPPEATEEVAEEPEIPPQTVKPVRVPPRKVQFACMECGASFKMRPELVGHAKKNHPDKISAILAPYPVTG